MYNVTMIANETTNGGAEMTKEKIKGNEVVTKEEWAKANKAIGICPKCGTFCNGDCDSENFDE